MGDDSTIQLSVVHSVYKNKTIYQKLEGGELYPEQKEVLVKQIRVKKWFRREAIVSVEEYVNSKHKVCPKRSVIFDKFSGRFYATYHSPQEVLQHIDPKAPTNPIGFHKYDSNIYTPKSQVQQHRTRRY
jgi:hypothetical protein